MICIQADCIIILLAHILSEINYFSMALVPHSAQDFRWVHAQEPIHRLNIKLREFLKTVTDGVTITVQET
jgi:hypothetical protein